MKHNMDLIDNCTIYLPCSCQSHLIGIFADLEKETDYHDFTLLWLSFFAYGSSSNNLWTRIKNTWRYFWQESVEFNNIGLSPLNAIKLRDWLNEVIIYHTKQSIDQSS